jgi:hypothetical protein
MHLSRPASTPLVRRSSKHLVALLLAITALSGSHAAGAAPIMSRLLIDPAGEHDGDIFGSSVASVGDVNGDGYDDIVIGANFYPSEGGQGRAYLFFGGPGIDSVADLVLPPPTGGTG